jgi:hypothetical protein
MYILTDGSKLVDIYPETFVFISEYKIMDKIHGPRNTNCSTLSLGPFRIKMYAIKLGVLFIYSPVSCAFLEVATHKDEE